MTDLAQHKAILIFGFGLEGRAFYNYAKVHNLDARLYVLDDALTAIPDDVDIQGIFDTATPLKVQLARHDISLIVRSPGVSIYRDEFKVFEALDIDVTTGTNLWLGAHQDAQTIAITGTKGKSTTVKLVDFILSQLGYDTAILGNLGTPLLASKPAKDFTILELSSYQTADLSQGPSVAVFTNLFEEHLQWHGDVVHYHRDKLRLARLNPATRSFCLEDDEAVLQGLEGVPSLRSLVWQDMSLTQGVLKKDGATLAKNVPLKGAHNLKNLALAFGVVEAVTGIDIKNGPIDFTTFDELPHRLAEHQLDQHMLAVDDSIATIPHATLSALDVYSARNVHLFIGGQDRGIDYTDLIDGLHDRALASLCLFGPVGRRVDALLSGELQNTKRHVAEKLGGVIQLAFEQANSGDVFLLSPAATSFDEFKNFAARGDYFVAQCRHYAARK